MKQNDKKRPDQNEPDSLQQKEELIDRMQEALDMLSENWQAYDRMFDAIIQALERQTPQ